MKSKILTQDEFIMMVSDLVQSLGISWSEAARRAGISRQAVSWALQTWPQHRTRYGPLVSIYKALKDDIDVEIIRVVRLTDNQKNSDEQYAKTGTGFHLPLEE